MMTSSSPSSSPSVAGPLIFITGNEKKLAEVRAILSTPNTEGSFEMTNVKLDLPELQGEPEEVAREKCRLALEHIEKTVAEPRWVMVEDTSLCFNALNGLPGVYIKWFLKSLGHDGLNRILAGYEDKSAYAQCIFCIGRTHSSGESSAATLQTFVGRTPGKIVPPRGPTDFGWDPVFEPSESGGLTYAEMEKGAKNLISHRGRALQQLRAHLQQLRS